MLTQKNSSFKNIINTTLPKVFFMIYFFRFNVSKAKAEGFVDLGIKYGNIRS